MSKADFSELSDPKWLEPTDTVVLGRENDAEIDPSIEEESSDKAATSDRPS